MSTEPHVRTQETLVENTDRGRFELYRDGELVGWLFRTHLIPNRYALLHTEVEASHQGQGVAGAMVRRVLDEIRGREGTITVICPFLANYLSRATEYSDLIDPRRPGYSDRASAELAHTKGAGHEIVGHA
ncbi:N-acetyltransferase [Diaminobutyricibacter tongyongensis]|uniref:N-acetyltransferase n=1 Tax=Leifsonia tongyongensis TaxID=1268043 RepID=A0A6L9Y3D3_9MICO|nr:GNAT family N-acetyltransferase [Diaminobutyricibacter tongyongensis]NEN07768.1 N-acetyltransferase [Diaminobutyricibacter tongyongensis]